MENQVSNPLPAGSENSQMLHITMENQLSDHTAWVGKLPDAVNYDGKSTFRPHSLGRKTPGCNTFTFVSTPRPGSENSQMLWITIEYLLFRLHRLGQKTPRWCKLRLKINFFDPTAWVGKLPDAVNIENQLFRSHGMGQKTPRCCKLQLKIKF